MSAQTLPGLLLEREAATPNGGALRVHRLGIWEEETWSAFAADVRNCGNGLAAAGVMPTDVVAIAMRNDPAWVIADLAIQGLGAVTLALDPDLSPDTITRLLAEHHAVAVVAGDQEQFDKVEGSRSALRELRTVVVVHTRGMRHLDRESSNSLDNGTLTWAHLCEIGSKSPDVWKSSAAGLDPALTATIECVIERTEAGGIVRTHTTSSAELLEHARELGSRLGAHAGDELYPIATFADPVERLLSEVIPLQVGAVINIGEGGALSGLEARAVQPTIAHLPAGRLLDIRQDVARRQAKRGLRQYAVGRLFATTSDQSRSSRRDLQVTYGVAALWAAVSLLTYRGLASVNGLARLALVVATGVAALGLLVGRGFAVRPFVRKAYGLSRAHSLLTSPDVDTETIRFLGALHLHPILERRNAANGATS